MKTLKQVTLTATMILFAAHISMAGSFTKFQMHLTDGRTIEVISRVEKVVKENIPSYMTPADSQPGAEDNPGSGITNREEPQSDRFLRELISQMQKPESPVLEKDLDTRSIFMQHLEQNRYRITFKELSSLIKTEKEIEEEHPLSLGMGMAK